MIFATEKKAVGRRRTYKDDRDTKFASVPSFLSVAHVTAIMVDNIQVSAPESIYRDEPRHAFTGHNLKGGYVKNIRRDPLFKDQSLVQLEQCNNISERYR